MTFGQCANLMDMVRAFFKEGNKSNNKRYSANDIVKRGGGRTATLTTKRNNRNQKAELSIRYRPSGCKTHLEMAYHLQHMGSDNVSGNCYEMAVMSAFYAMQKYNVKAWEMRLAEVMDPGDHAFCLVGVPQHLENFECNSVRDFTETNLANATYVIDPWLNTVCKGSHYLLTAKQRLQKWHRDCKRIAWSGRDGDADGWYSPLGEYADVFEDEAPIEFARFSGFK